MLTLNGPRANSQFGRSVSVSQTTVDAVSQTTVVVGTEAGLAFIYFGCDSLSSIQCIDNARNTLQGPASSFFGWTVAVSGSVVVVGTYVASGNSIFVYYDCTLSTFDNCNEFTDGLQLKGPTVSGMKVSMVSISDSTIAVASYGAYGGVSAFYGCTSRDSTTCTDANRVSISVGTWLDMVGFLSISVSGSLIAVVNPTPNRPAYLYYGCTSSSSTTCNDANRIELKANSNSLIQGYGVAVDAGTVVVGSNGIQANGSPGNQAFVYLAQSPALSGTPSSCPVLGETIGTHNYKLYTHFR
jgi:hypothetical protein